MSRTLGQRQCAVPNCGGEVVLDHGQWVMGDIRANAHCQDCGALYVADTQPPIRDLAFRHANNDEPSAKDLEPVDMDRLLDKTVVQSEKEWILRYFETYRGK